MRRIALTDEKLRGIPRRLRALKRWAESFKGWFPDGLTAERRYYNFKIPVHVDLVEGSQSTPGVRAECAQRMIDACAHLIAAKPDDAIASWVIALICVPDMFTSEICIYTDEDYYRGQTTPSQSEFGGATIIADRSLAREWGLVLPPGIQERGLLLNYQYAEDSDDRFISEHWSYGVDPCGDIG